MICPHCLVDFHALLHEARLLFGASWDADSEGKWQAVHTVCPRCRRRTIMLQRFDPQGMAQPLMMVYPRGMSRAPLSPEVPEPFASDYREGCLVLADSPKASAALSRRCLQALLRAKAGVKPSDLAKEIDEVLASRTLPSDLAGAIDAIRVVGNFAAHPIKSTATGQIVEVEPGEAELLLDVLESLFDFYFIRPAQLQAKLDAVNKKLVEAGKPPLKQPPP